MKDKTTETENVIAQLNSELKRRFVIACATNRETQSEVLRNAVESYINKTEKREMGKVR